MKYCKFQLNGEAHYGLVEPVAGRDSIFRILLTAPEDSDGDVEGLRSRRIEPIALDEAMLLPPVRPTKNTPRARSLAVRAFTRPHARRSSRNNALLLGLVQQVPDL